MSDTTAAAEQKRPARLVGDPQVDVALAVAGVGVGEAVPLVGERARASASSVHEPTFTDSSPAPGRHHLAA